MLKKTLPLLFVLITFNSLHSQGIESSNQYLPEDMDEVGQYLKKINSDYLKRIGGVHQLKIKKIFKDRDEKVVESINDSTYIFNSDIDKAFGDILLNVYEANQDVNKQNHRFFINTSFIPNAACYGDGMFEVNLGLFSTMESDDEIAFVICHELAHQLLEHSLHKVTNVISKINSKETKKKVKAIKRQKYGQTRAAMSVIDELSIDILDHSKESEAQADSLGFILFSKTIYNTSKAPIALNQLRLNDDMLLDYDVKIDSVFSFKTYPFKSFWLKESTSIFNTKEKINEFSLDSDTLKTHPEIAYRIEKLTRDFSIDDANTTSHLNQIKVLKGLADLKSIESSIDKKLLDFAIYQLVEKYNKGAINSDYYHVTMAKVIKQIYDAKKRHELGKFVPPKNNFSDEKHLNTIRLFLNNLELGETKKIGLAFCETHKEVLLKDNDGTDVYEFFKSINQ